MNIEKVESLLERCRPATPPPVLRRRIVEAAGLKLRAVPVPRKPRFVEVMTVAASILMLLGTVTWLLREAPPTSGPAARDGGQPFEERRLADALPEGTISGFTWSADGKHWACVATQQGGKSCAVIDGKREPEYTTVNVPTLGPDGRYAYVARDAKKGFMLVVDGVSRQDFKAYDAVAWSPDGKTLAFVGVRGNKFHVVVDGKESQGFDAVWDLTWAPNGGMLAYAAQIDNDHFVVVDGKKAEPFDSVRDFTFSPDGKNYAYAAKEGAWMVVVGDRKGSEYVSVGRPVFSPDGSTYGYSAIGNGQHADVVAGPWTRNVLAMQVPMKEAGTPVFSRDGKVWAYRAVPRGPEKKAQMRISRTTLNKGENISMEEAGPLYDSVSDPVVNPDGSLVAYAAGKGSRMYLVVGERTNLKFSSIDRISFGPDGRTVAFLAGQYGKQFVVAGQSRGDEFDEVMNGPVWSADGRKVAFTARNGGELWTKVLEVK